MLVHCWHNRCGGLCVCGRNRGGGSLEPHPEKLTRQRRQVQRLTGNSMWTGRNLHVKRRTHCRAGGWHRDFAACREGERSLGENGNTRSYAKTSSVRRNRSAHLSSADSGVLSPHPRSWRLLRWILSFSRWMIPLDYLWTCDKECTHSCLKFLTSLRKIWRGIS